MHGLAHNLFLAEIGIPDVWQCLGLAGPFLALFALRWVIRHTDEIIEKLFPHWEWERKLGWLNISAQRQAETVLRWIGYCIYALLAAALYGIVWSVSGVGNLKRLDDPGTAADAFLKLSVLLVCLGLWLVYLGCELIPKLREQAVREELAKAREEDAELDEEEPSYLKPPSRFAGTDLGSRNKPLPWEHRPRR
jgi:hypothetical protein